MAECRLILVCAADRGALVGRTGGLGPPTSKKTVCWRGPGGLIKSAKSM